MRDSQTLSLLSRIREQETLEGVATFLTRLLQDPSYFNAQPEEIDLELEISWQERPTPQNVTEISLQSIAFGIIWQQERQGGGVRVRHPFRYESVSGIQDACNDTGVASLFGELRRRPNGPAARLEESYIAQEFDLAEPLAHHVLTMIVFGTFVEQEGLEEVALS